jgi:hypothetical protein
MTHGSNAAADTHGFRFQVSNFTESLRYLEFYRTIAFDIGIGATPRILVFGCSTGEEIGTVYRFWPHADIYACDVQEDMIDATRRQYPAACVFPSNPSEVARHGPFDFIAANSVLCRNPLPAEAISTVIPFGRFDEYIALLTDNLVDGGMLMIFNSNYFVQDTQSYRRLIEIAISGSWFGATIPRLNALGNVVASPNRSEGRFSNYTIAAETAPDTLMRMSCALFRKNDSKKAGVVRVTTGAHLLESRPQIGGLPEFPEVGDFATVYRCFVVRRNICEDDKHYFLTETYVTDFIDRRWARHGTSYELSAANDGSA